MTPLNTVTVTVPMWALVIGLILVAVLLCVLATIASNHLDHKWISNQKSNLGTWQGELIALELELHARQLELRRQAQDVATLARYEMEMVSDETEIRFQDWELGEENG